ncbi:MAG: hypothetical protein F6K31_22935 [Symploca sp. SIO2G7]|nr:hypothetical protein [Symploca sp. SIO2G7]
MKNQGRKSPWIITNAAKVRLTILFILLLGFILWTRFTLSDVHSPEETIVQAKTLEAVYHYGNYLEAGIWGTIAFGFYVQAIRKVGRLRHHAIITAVIFSLFGLSDIVEVETGAWWRPWWLFVWKSFCVICLFGLFVAYQNNGD